MSVGNWEVPQEDINQYAMALLTIVIELHEKTGLLHCDIKPDNVMWDPNTKLVRLIDFGHAQQQENAKAYRGTKGFEVPEIVAGDPHTQSSDAFSVG